MSKLEVFRRQASPGATVTLRLTRGEDVTGRIAELDDSHVCLDLGQRVVTIFEDILAGWEIHQASQEDTLGGSHQDIPSRSEPTVSDDQTSEFVAATPPPIQVSSLDPVTLERRARIEAAYAEGAKHARLQPPQLDFGFPEDEFSAPPPKDVRREWDRAKNQCEYGLKVREESRFNVVVTQVLRPLAERFPQVPAIRALLGQLLLRLGSRAEAVDHLRTAAFASRKPAYWHALAYAAADSALECYALRNYLLLVRSLDEVREAWLRYFWICVPYADAKGIVEVLERAFSSEAGRPAREMAAETLVYTFGRIDASDIARSVVTGIVRGEFAPPEGWRECISSRLPQPMDELAREEARRATSSPRVVRQTAVPAGVIASFGNQRFGFIQGEDGETYFFRIDDVLDEGLKQQLLDGTWRKDARVEFTIVPSPGHRYHSGTQVMRFLDGSALLQRAQLLARNNQYSQAMSLVRRALSSNPDDPAAARIQADVKEQMRRALARGIGLPVGDGPFALAKRAQLVDQDLKTAERFFRQAIRLGDSTESAVKDLASLLQQEGRNRDAVTFLETMRKRYDDVSPYDNHLANLLQHAGRHREAITILEGLLLVATGKARHDLLRRVAFSYFKAGDYDKAERGLRDLLRRVPGDRTAQRWLTGLEEARRSGSYAEAAEIIGGFVGLAEQGLELSPLARHAIASCSFEGVDPAKVQTGALTSKDAERLEDLAKELGTRRPRDRAAYYLSAAAILSRQRSDDAAARVYDYLRRHFASMGDAAWVGKLPADTARTYYIESLGLVSESGDEPWRTLLRYLITYNPDRQEEFEGVIQHSRKYKETLRAAVKGIYCATPEHIMEALTEVAAQSSFASQALLVLIPF